MIAVPTSFRERQYSGYALEARITTALKKPPSRFLLGYALFFRITKPSPPGEAAPLFQGPDPLSTLYG